MNLILQVHTLNSWICQDIKPKFSFFFLQHFVKPLNIKYAGYVFLYPHFTSLLERLSVNHARNLYYCIVW